MGKLDQNKILVIGGSGFVGTNLISLVGDKKCLNFDKNESKKFKKITQICDIRDLSSITIPEDIKTVILLAAEHKDNVSPTDLYYDVNVKGTKNVLEKMDDLNIKNLIFTSSVAVYGLNKKNPNEDFKKDPFNHYGKSKYQAEKVIMEWYNKNPDNKSVSIVRPTVIFGRNNRGNVYNLFKQLASGRFVMIGSGLNKKSMAYIDNVTSFIYHLCIKSEKGFNIYNYSDKPDLNMNELIDIIKKHLKLSIINVKIPYLLGLFLSYIFDFVSLISNKKLAISSVRVKKFCATTQFDSSKMYAEFNPPYSLEEGLSKTLKEEYLN